MTLEIIPRSSFYFSKNMAAAEKPDFASRSQRLWQDRISLQIDMFAQEIAESGFEGNRLQIENKIRSKLYVKIKSLMARFLAKHPYQKIDDACFIKAQAIRSLIVKEMPQFAPYLGLTRHAVAAAARPSPLLGKKESALSESEESDQSLDRQTLEEHLAALIQERKALRSQLNALKLEENNWAHIIANLLDQPPSIEQNHRKRKPTAGQMEHQSARGESFDREGIIKRLEQAIKRNEQSIADLKAQIEEKRNSNRLEFQKATIIAHRRSTAERASQETPTPSQSIAELSSSKTPTPAIALKEEESSETVSYAGQNSDSSGSAVPTPQEEKQARPLKSFASQFSAAILQLVPRSVRMAQRKHG